MKPIIFIAFLGFVLSCEKDKTPLPCTGISMTGERELFVGKWRWYKTWVVEWFDIGNPITHDYTPQNQSFEYYFTLSSDGQYSGYRNDTLVHSFLLSDISSENFENLSLNYITSNIDCSKTTIDLLIYNPTNNTDSIRVREYPFHFDDQENHLYSTMNFFVKE